MDSLWITYGIATPFYCETTEPLIKNSLFVEPRNIYDIYQLLSESQMSVLTAAAAE